MDGTKKRGIHLSKKEMAGCIQSYTAKDIGPIQGSRK